MPPAERRARRLRLLTVLPVVLVVGLAARFGLGGWPADAAGGVMYTALVYLVVAIARPDLRPAALAATALAISVAVELFQLTPYPQDLADAFSPSRLVFGTSFSGADLPPYAVGAALAAAIDRWWSSRHRARD